MKNTAVSQNRVWEISAKAANVLDKSPVPAETGRNSGAFPRIAGDFGNMPQNTTESLPMLYYGGRMDDIIRKRKACSTIGQLRKRVSPVRISGVSNGLRSAGRGTGGSIGCSGLSCRGGA